MTVAPTPSPTSTETTVDPRHAQALAALRSAEARTGVRKRATVAPVQVRALRSRPAAVPIAESAPESAAASPESAAAAAVVPAAVVATRPAPESGPDEGARVLPVHPHLAALLPDGGLRAGTAVVVRGSTSLLLTLLAEASRAGAWTVLVGFPAAGLAAAADAGCDLSRTLVVPLSGSAVDAPAVLAALIDGMDVVVVGPGAALLGHDRRRLTARARERGTVLVAAGSPLDGVGGTGGGGARGAGGGASAGAGGWPGAQVVLEATAGTWAGVERGAGWLRRRTLRVRRTGRGNAARPLHLDVEVPVCRATTMGADLAGGKPGSTNLAGGPSLVREDADPGEASARPRLELVG